MSLVFNKKIYFSLLVLLVCTGTAGAASVDLRFGNTLLTKEVTSFRELRFENIVQQTKDFSCGAATMATLLTHYFGQETSEAEVLEEVVLKADEATLKRIKKNGISLFDLKLFGEKRGLVAKGLRMKPEQLKTIDRPAIVLVNYRGYSHFVVIKGIKQGKVFVADPARGPWSRNLEEFADMWNGVLLAFRRDDGQRVADHDLKIEPFWPRGAVDLLPTDLLEVQFASGPNEF